uniref:Rx N-terminal domain-containing protein n=1 Tax=Oryza glaberrima TaxID=4538 RepID=I1Q8U9_ORYGL
MESAVASYAEGVGKAIVGKIGQLVSDEFRLLSGVRGEIVYLRDDVAIMNALLRMLSEADEGTVVHFVREWMKQVRELAYDAEDCIDLFLLRISFAPPRAGALGRAWRRLVTIGPRHRLAVDIQNLHARALAISERRVRYEVDGQALRPSVWFVPAATAATMSSAAHTLRLHPANEYPSKFLGIGDQVQRLSDLVKSNRLTSDNNEPDVSLKVFSIVGFGGLGKTTLAMEVCRNLEEEFPCQAMVSVSQAFDSRKDLSGLLKRMLQQIVRVRRDLQLQEEKPLANIDDGDADWLAMKLREHLADRRYGRTLALLICPATLVW